MHVSCLLETMCTTECPELSDFIQFYLLNCFFSVQDFYINLQVS